MEGDERQMKEHILDVTDRYVIIKCKYWHINFEVNTCKQ